MWIDWVDAFRDGAYDPSLGCESAEDIEGSFPSNLDNNDVSLDWTAFGQGSCAIDKTVNPRDLLVPRFGQEEDEHSEV